MNTALATQETGILTRYGSEQEIKTFMARAAAIFQIPEEEVNRPDVQASLTKATQYCINLGLLPGVHVHMIPFNKKVIIPNPTAANPQGTIEKWEKTYSPDLGEKAWKDSANRAAAMGRFAYVVETRAMTPAELQEATKTAQQEYSPEDAGCWARVLRSDHADLYKQVGSKYAPEWSTGFWRKKAKQDYKKQWISDSLPVQRTPADVALRRATKAALMAVFTLVPLDEYTASQRFRQLSAYVEDATAQALPVSHAETALIADSRYYRGEDGEIWDGQAPTAYTWEAQKPILIAQERAKIAAELAFDLSSLDEVDPLDFGDESTPTAEFLAIPSQEPGMVNGHTAGTNGNGKAEDGKLPKPILRKLHAVGTDLYGADWDTKRFDMVQAVTKGKAQSSSDLTVAQAETLISGMEKRLQAAAAAVAA